MDLTQDTMLITGSMDGIRRLVATRTPAAEARVLVHGPSDIKGHDTRSRLSAPLTARDRVGDGGVAPCLAARVAYSALRFVLAFRGCRLMAQLHAVRGGPSIARSRSPAWSIAHRAFLQGCGASARPRTRQPALSGPSFSFVLSGTSHGCFSGMRSPSRRDVHDPFRTSAPWRT